MRCCSSRLLIILPPERVGFIFCLKLESVGGVLYGEFYCNWREIGGRRPPRAGGERAVLVDRFGGRRAGWLYFIGSGPMGARQRGDVTPSPQRAFSCFRCRRQLLLAFSTLAATDERFPLVETDAVCVQQDYHLASDSFL